MNSMTSRMIAVLAAVVGSAGWLAAQTPAGASSADPDAWLVTRRSLAAGAAGASVIDLEEVLPREVRQGQPFDYRLRVANCADCPVAEVAVVQRLPAGVTLLGSYPQAEVKDGVATWRLGTLAVRESRVIQARAMTNDIGPLTFCCDTLYRAPLCATIASTRPELQIALEAPVEGTPCDVLPVQLTVRNTGTGTCRDVRMQYTLPEGMSGPDDRRAYVYQVGTLPPGEARRTQLNVRALRTGAFQHQAAAVTADGPRSDAAAETRVVAPRLTVTQEGTEQQFAGRNVTYSFTVRNDGDTEARNVLVEDLLPSGVKVVDVKPPAGNAAATDRVVWRLTALPPDTAMEFSVTVKAEAAGAFANRVTARADCAQDAAATYASQVRGVPAILLEVVDQDDPIEVGGKDTYVITATNQGTAPCTNLVVKCVLEDYVQYAAADGPTAATASGAEVAFGPLPVLEPKATAVWKVTCSALKAGDARFKVLLTSDQLTRPVEETESTHLY